MRITISIFLMLSSLVSQAQDASRLLITDSRSTNALPGDYSMGVHSEFKSAGAISVPGSNDYGALVSIIPWLDASGGKRHQLFFNDNGMFLRRGIAGQTTWEGWQKGVFSTDDNMIVLNKVVWNEQLGGVKFETYGASNWWSGIKAFGCGGADQLDLRFYTTYQIPLERMRIDQFGNVGIGTSTPNEKLSVNGSIRAKTIKVENNNWPDYVFKSGYQLMSLDKLEDFIKTKGHLPNVPSAEQVSKEGVDLSANQAILLKKIEELTLYVIDIKKENERLRAEISDLKKEK